MTKPFNPNRLVQFPIDPHTQRIVTDKFIPIQEAIDSGQLPANAPVLYTDREEGILVFRTRHMVVEVMQGAIKNTPFMAAFCSACNAGMSFSPIIEGKVYDFHGIGMYDAMTTICDMQTNSYWEVVTGECFGGPMRGARLNLLSNMLHSVASVVARATPTALYAITKLTPLFTAVSIYNEAQRLGKIPSWTPKTPVIGASYDPEAEDTRLPRLEMGLGLWTDEVKRFYPVKLIYAKNNFLFDQIGGKPVLIYIDPESSNPAALYTEATGAVWRGESLALNNGQVLRDGNLTEKGTPVPVNRPLQLFQRWYGFSITFPGCEVWQSPDESKSGAG
jgi:hypothetical protein